MFITTNGDKKSIDRAGILAFHTNFYNSCMLLSKSEKVKVFELFLGNVFEELGFINVGEGKWFKDQYLITYNLEDCNSYLRISYDWELRQVYTIHPNLIEDFCIGDICNISAQGLRESCADATLEILLDRVVKDIRNIWKKFVLGQELGEEDGFII